MSAGASPSDDIRTAGGRRPGQPLRARPVAAVEAGFRALARLREAPALHPHGLTCTAEVEVVADRSGPWRVPWLDARGHHTAMVRLSRAAGLPRRVPDWLGLAVRVPDADGPDHTLDLLLTSSGRGRFTRHLPLPRADVLRGPYSSLLPYRVADRRCLLAAFPRRAGRGPVPGDPAGVADALAAGPLVFDLCAEGGDRTWRRFAVLTVRDVLPLGQEETLDFDIYRRSVRAFAPGGALAATRRAAYRGSRAGRRAP
ncbi:phosphodiesterase [Streptomyces sp. SudanB52_2052]|uniref:phosphodiesterase n=1 Tax=Streptomyces sp. SudanB52_2052 TaxID=3035276 RepID=UPI003F554F17